MKIAPDVDKLMWNIADSGDPSAIESFHNRFPDLKHELAKRVLLIGDLRVAKSLHVKPMVRPSFTPVSIRRGSWLSRRGIVGGALLLGAALAAASYVVIANKGQNNPSPPPMPVRSAVPSVYIDACKPLVTAPSAPRIVYGSSTAGTTNQGMPLGNETQPRTNIVPYPPDANSTTPPIGSDSAKDSTQLQNVRLTDVNLSVALRAIASKCGLVIETGPNMPDPLVDHVEYSSMDAISILRDMGTKYKFSVLEEGRGKVLLLPVASFTPN